MSELSMILGDTKAITIKVGKEDKIYILKPFDLDAELEFEKRLYEKDLDALDTQRKRLGEEKYWATMEVLRQNQMGGRYNPRCEIGSQFLASVGGAILCYSILSKTDENEVKKMLVSAERQGKTQQLNWLLAEALEELSPGTLERLQKAEEQQGAPSVATAFVEAKEASSKSG